MGGPVNAGRAGTTVHDFHASDGDVRRELARELHDSVVQTLQLMLVEMEQFKAERFDPTAVVHEVSEYQACTREVLNELRAVLYELRDEPGVDSTFTEGMRALVAKFRARTGIYASLTVTRAWPTEVRRVAAVHVRRIVEEGLTNVRRHSDAHLCHVRLAAQDEDTLKIQIRDDGVGISLAADRGPGLGLAGMHERVVLLGGHLSLLPAHGGGTVLTAVFPRGSVA